MTRKISIKLLRQKSRFEIWILAVPIVFSLFGLLMIYEASNVSAFYDFGDKYHYVKDQFAWFIVGLMGLFLTSRFHYKKYYFISIPLIIFSILSLVAVFIPGVGIKAQGASRWIDLSIFSFQPSELAKLVSIVYLSSWFSTKEKGRFTPFLFLVGLIVGLVIIQPDLGTAIILSTIFTVMYFLSGAPFWHFIILIPFIIGAGVGLVATSPYRLQRVLSFFNPNFDPLGASYHIRQVLIAFGSGGLFGIGLGGSRQKYQYLPEANTDSIFAIIGEEFGFTGSLIIIFLFVIFLYRIYQIAKYSPDRQSFLLACGFLSLFGSQTLINLSAMVALVPLTGVPLPFISYGGSNLIVSLVSVGILLNISKYNVIKG